MGFVAAARLMGKTLFYGSYPITPASDVLHELARLRHFGVMTFQAETKLPPSVPPSVRLMVVPWG